MTELSKTSILVSAMAHLYEMIFFLRNDACAGQVLYEGDLKEIESFDMWCEKHYGEIYDGDDVTLFLEKISAKTIVNILQTEDEYKVEFSVTEEGDEHRKCLSAFCCKDDAVCIYVRDVTSAHKKEQERERVVRESLEAAQHAFLAMGQFGDNINEEIKLPVLQAMESLEESFKKEPEDAREYVKHTVKILENHINKLEGLLSFSKVEAGKENENEDIIIVSDFLDDLGKMTAMLTGINAEKILIQDKSKKAKAFVSNYILLKQILGNALAVMISNSSDCSADAVFDMEEDKLLFAVTARGAEEAVLKNGYMKYINSFAAYMNGRVCVEIQKDEEQIILTVEIPVKQAERSQYRKKKLATRMKNNVLDRDFSAFRALVVDDDKVSRGIITSKLKQFGLDVEEASDGEEAMEKLLASPGRYYQIIFTKMLLLKKNGLDMTMELRELTRRDLNDITIVAVTSNPMKDKRLTALEHGMDYHLPLPLNDLELREILIRELENIGPEENHEKFGFRVIK